MTAAPPAPAALLCPAVEDVTGFPCRRIACDGSHSASGVDPWSAPQPSPATEPEEST
jgi:hypothetical protein